MRVVYHPFPTSNHNNIVYIYRCKSVVYHPFPTSNHNSSMSPLHTIRVVYHPFPTSNHNSANITNNFNWLYIILFLHQTTTYPRWCPSSASCISSFSYIKPQPCPAVRFGRFCCISSFSYIKPQHLS